MINNSFKKIYMLIVTALCLFSVSAFAGESASILEDDLISSSSTGPWDWQANYGKVKRLYPTGGASLGARTFFQLKNGQTAMNPSSDYYYIPKSNSNYQAMVDLLYLAAEHQWVVHARTQHNLDSNGHAEVIYLVVDR